VQTVETQVHHSLSVLNVRPLPRVLSMCWFLLVGGITTVGQQSSLPGARKPQDQSRHSNAGRVW
jgi:hypothetical protein